MYKFSRSFSEHANSSNESAERKPNLDKPYLDSASRKLVGALYLKISAIKIKPSTKKINNRIAPITIWNV